jgi:hypothetical protein
MKVSAFTFKREKCDDGGVGKERVMLREQISWEAQDSNEA